MVMGGKKAYPLKCESCGHEDAVFFDRRAGVGLKELAFKAKGHKACQECGGKMTIDLEKTILF